MLARVRRISFFERKEKPIRYKAIIEYNGSRFHGWQLQPEARTVQGDVERILEIVLREPIRIQGSGRTDTGVHARGQVFHFDSTAPVDAHRLQHAVNGMLKGDAVIHAIEEVPSDFNARFSATQRTYKYYISEQPIALGSDFMHISKPLDLELLNGYAAVLLGEHDFTSFSKVNLGVDDHQSIIYNAFWQRKNNAVVFEVTAIRFLRGMVRGLVGTSLFLEKNKAPAADMRRILEAKDRSLAKFHAPARGLVLEHVKYD